VRDLRTSRAAEDAEVRVGLSDDVLVIEDLPELSKRDIPRNWDRRPQNWESIVEYYVESSHNIDAILQQNDKEFQGYNSTQAKKRVEEWVRNKKANIKVEYTQRQPVYGFEVDMQLLSDVEERTKLGLRIDAFILRGLLVALLTVHNKLDLLTTNNGKNTFGDAWATRFYKRHKFKCRAATSKMIILLVNNGEV